MSLNDSENRTQIVPTYLMLERRVFALEEALTKQLEINRKLLEWIEEFEFERRGYEAQRLMGTNNYNR